MNWPRTATKFTQARFLLILLLLAGGCGYAEYEFRLNESKKYYSYLDRIEQSLSPKWAAAGNLMELRVPRQFILIQPPQPVQKEDGSVEASTIDPRQPDYLNLTFPELFGAWETKLRVTKTDGTSEERKGYLYALSNYWQLAGDQASEAGQFVSNFKTYLSEKLQTPVSDERSEIQPGGPPGYQPQSAYDVCSFKGKEIDGVNYSFEVYAKTQGSVIGVLVIVLPEGMEMPQKVSERIPLMLGAFSFTKEPPRQGAEKNATAPAQAAQKNTGF